MDTAILRKDRTRPRYTLEYEPEIVGPFVSARIDNFEVSGAVATIGLRRDGELVAGVVYEGFNGHNMWMHVAAIPGRHWLVRGYIKACFVYPFEVCKVQRVSGYVDDSNMEARRFDEHLGFRVEARLRGAANDGGDVLIYVMRREDCRYV